MIWKKNFGKEIKRERMSCGMSRTKLSRLSHVDRETIIDIENGRIKNPDFYEMLNICEILDTSVYFYIVEEEKIDD